MKRLVAVAILLSACKGRDKEVARHDPTTGHDPCGQAAEPPEAMRWIKDDLPLAVKCAQAAGVPLVLDLWAPWCHTCLSMQSTVFTDPSFAADAHKFVFASLDTDREGNAAAVGRYPLSAWPTFYVIKPEGTVLARYVGAASVAQFHSFLDAGLRALAGGAAGADAHLLSAERAIQTKDLATAEAELNAALLDAPADWKRRPDALVSLIHTKRKRDDLAGCLDLAEASIDDTGASASATDFVVLALDCATSREKDEAERVTKLRERAVIRVTKLLDDPSAQLSVDDRSDALVMVRETLDVLGRHTDALGAAEKQRVLLDDAVAKAPSPIAAMTYNYQRADAYVYLGRPLDIVPALEKSATDLPTEYDPRARLGRVLLEAGKLDEAAKWTDAALALVYGPRKARVLAQRAEIAAKQGDKIAERAYRAAIVTVWESLPPGQANADALAKAKDAVAKLDDLQPSQPAAH